MVAFSRSSHVPSTSHASSSFFFFFNDTATTEIYTLSLHDALPICARGRDRSTGRRRPRATARRHRSSWCRRDRSSRRSEEHTSELQSRPHLVCRLLLEKKKNYPTLQILRVSSLLVGRARRSAG